MPAENCGMLTFVVGMEDKHNIDYLWWAGSRQRPPLTVWHRGGCVITASDRPRAPVRVSMLHSPVLAGAGTIKGWLKAMAGKRSNVTVIVRDEDEVWVIVF